MTASAVNPLYENVISWDNLDPSADEDNQTCNQTPTLYSSNKIYESIDDAASYLLQNMENRRKEISFVYRSSKMPTKDLFNEIFDKALVHKDDPSGGDYMRWDMANGRLSCPINISILYRHMILQLHML